MNEELGERVISAIYQENHGNRYHRQGVIVDRWLDGLVAATTREIVMCDFRNQWGWCKFEKGHSGKHTVIYLGKD